MRLSVLNDGDRWTSSYYYFVIIVFSNDAVILLLTLMNVTRKPILYFSAQLSRVSDTVNAHPARHCGLRPFFFPSDAPSGAVSLNMHMRKIPCPLQCILVLDWRIFFPLYSNTCCRPGTASYSARARTPPAARPARLGRPR